MRRIAATVLVCLLIWSRVDGQHAAAAPAAVPVALVLVPVDAASVTGARSVVLRTETAVPLRPVSRLGGTRRPSDASLALGGVVGGIGGGLVLGGLGVLAGAQDECDDCYVSAQLVLGVLGVATGVTFGIPLGVSAANGRRGRTGGAMLASLGVLAAGIGIAASGMSDEQAGWMFVAIPLAQVGASVAVIR